MVDETRSSNRRMVIVLAVLGLLLASVAGVIILTQLLGDRDSGEATETAESATLMSDDTFMFMTFNPHLDQAKNFEVVEKAWGTNPLVREGLTKMLDSMRNDGLDYKSEIESWLGDEVAFSIGPDFIDSLGSSFEGIEGALSGDFDPSASMGEVSAASQFVIAAATKDQAASDKFLEKLRAEAESSGADWQETEYRDVKIVHLPPESEKDVGVAYATMDGFVILAVGGLETMQAIIDVQDGTNLTDNAHYRDVLERLPADHIGYGFLNTGDYVESAADVVGSELTELLNVEQLEAFKGIGFSVGLEPNGLRFDVVMVYDNAALSDDLVVEANSEQTAERIPADTLLYISGSGLGNIVQMGLDAISALPDQPEDLDEQLEMLTAFLGVSLDELVEILSGEFAIAVGHDPSGIGGDPSVPIGASFMLAVDEEGKLERLLNSLSSLLAFGAEMEFPKETVGDVEVTTITDPTSGNMIAGWGVGGDYFALGTSKALLGMAFGEGGDALSDNPDYRATIASLPEKKTGLFYMNLSELLNVVIEAMDPLDLESFGEARSILAPIRAVGAAFEPFNGSNDSVSGTLFVLIEGE